MVQCGEETFDKPDITYRMKKILNFPFPRFDWGDCKVFDAAWETCDTQNKIKSDSNVIHSEGTSLFRSGNSTTELTLSAGRYENFALYVRRLRTLQAAHMSFRSIPTHRMASLSISMSAIIAHENVKNEVYCLVLVWYKDKSNFMECPLQIKYVDSSGPYCS